MVKLSSARIDLDAERDGVWVDCPMLPGFSVKLASTGSREFERELEKRMEPYRSLIRSDAEKSDAAPKFTTEMREQVVREAFASVIVRDWRGADDDSGNPIACTPEEALKVISDPQLRHVWEWIQRTAGARERYLTEKISASVGN